MAPFAALAPLFCLVSITDCGGGSGGGSASTPPNPTPSVIGSIKMRSLFRNKYVIEIDQVNAWTFRMPLYTISFFGESDTGPEIWVVLGPSKMEWKILVKRETSEWPLLAALSFIHVEAWNYG